MQYEVNFISRVSTNEILLDPEDLWLLEDYTWYIATTKDGNTYVKTTGTLRSYIHWFIIGKPLNNLYVDHINGNGLDNRRNNLRIVDNQKNQFNSKKHKIKSSKYKGVSFSKSKNKWRAYICPNRKYIHLGYYTNESNAVKAYNKKALELFGEFACLNQI